MKKLWILFILLSTLLAWGQSSSDAERLQQAIASFTRLQEQQQQGRLDFIECSEPAGPTRIADVRRATTTPAGNCRNGLPENKHRLMERDGFMSGDYLMRNLGGGNYAAVLNVDFVNGANATPGLAESMRTRTINCLREMRPYLRGPNGQTLDIQIISPQETESLPRGMRPRKITINVTREKHDYRGNAGNFGSNFQCMTIGHEMLHHLGLCDEYHEGVKKEEGTTRRMDWRCRPVTAGNSYMRNIQYAFRTQVPQTSRCTCGPECQRIMQQSPEVQRMYLSMNGDDYLNSEGSLTNENIINVVGQGNQAQDQTLRHCTSVSTSLPANTPPPVMKAFNFNSQNGSTYTFTTYRPRFNVGPQPSDNFLWYGVETYTCNCTGETNGYCTRLMEDMKIRARQVHPRVTCPEGSIPRNIHEGPAIGQQVPQSGMNCDSSGNCDLIVTSPANGESLLRPQHWERILAGDCRGGAARNYERCEEFAYRGRNPNVDLYYMRLPQDNNVNQCSGLPAECLDDRYYLDGVSAPVSAQ